MTVGQHGPGAARALIAAPLGARETQLVTHRVKQGPAGVRAQLGWHAVDAQSHGDLGHPHGVTGCAAAIRQSFSMIHGTSLSSVSSRTSAVSAELAGLDCENAGMGTALRRSQPIGSADSSILSSGSAGSILSIGSAGSILSIGSAGSILSIGSAGSILSVGSAGSIGCVLSVGSAMSAVSLLSAFSRWSVLAWRSRGQDLERRMFGRYGADLLVARVRPDAVEEHADLRLPASQVGP